MRFIFGVVIALVCATQISFAAPIYGAGARTCSQYNVDRQDSSLESMYFSWAQGYVSRLNVAAESAGRRTIDLTPGSFDTDAQGVFLRNYCRNNSGDLFVEAATSLWNRLVDLNGAGV